MGQKGMKTGGIEKATTIKGNQEPNIRVVMPNPVANSVAHAMNGQGMPALRYDEKKENETTTMGWYALEEFSNTVAGMIGETAQQFQETIQLVQSIGYVEDMARFEANVKVTMDDLSKFTDEFISIKAKHEAKHGFITEAADRVLYLGIFEDYRALAAYFQGTMHHKLIEFTEYALAAKDKYLEMQKQAEAEAQAQPETKEENHE